MRPVGEGYLNTVTLVNCNWLNTPLHWRLHATLKSVLVSRLMVMLLSCLLTNAEPRGSITVADQ